MRMHAPPTARRSSSTARRRSGGTGDRLDRLWLDVGLPGGAGARARDLRNGPRPRPARRRPRGGEPRPPRPGGGRARAREPGRGPGARRSLARGGREPARRRRASGPPGPTWPQRERLQPARPGADGAAPARASERVRGRASSAASRRALGGLLDSLRAEREYRARSARQASRRRFSSAGATCSTDWGARPNGAARRARRRKRRPPTRQLADRLDRLADLQTEIGATRPALPDLGPPRLEDLRQSLLDHDTVLLEYYLGTPHSYLWVVTADAVESVRFPRAWSPEALVRSTAAWLAGQSATTTRPGRPHPLGAAARQIAGKRLLVAADGALQYLPFAALPDPGAPGPLRGTRSTTCPRSRSWPS